MIDCDPVLRQTILGVYAADQLPVGVGTYGFIANTDNHGLPGTHWLAFFVQNNVIECFDSYGQSPGVYNTKFSQWIQRHARSVRVNSSRLQSDWSNVCGLYCVYFLHQRLLGHTMAEIVARFSGSDRETNDQYMMDLMLRVYPHCIAQDETYTQGCRPLCGTSNTY